MVRTRADNYDQRRQEILDSAANLFAERGFDATSISSIAQKCGVSKALLYHYYDSKEALLYAMLHSHCNLLVETATNATASIEDPTSSLYNLIRELMKLYVGSHDKHVVLLNELSCLSHEQQKEIKDLERSVVKQIKDLLSQLRPDLPEPKRTSLAMYFMGAINWTYTWFKPDGAVTSTEFADMATSVFLNGIGGELPV